MRPNLTVSLGLRYETQTNIHDWHDIAPRVGFAWSPDGGSKGNGKTVVRGGFGMFYDRFSESLTLQADRYNGGRPTALHRSPTRPSFHYRNSVDARPWRRPTGAMLFEVQPGLRAPRTMQSALGVERQLPWNTTLASNVPVREGRAPAALGRDLSGHEGDSTRFNPTALTGRRSG